MSNDRTTMDRLGYVLLWIAGILLIVNFFVVRTYGIAIRSTHAFIAGPLLFYPLSTLNLIAGLLIIVILVVRLLMRGKQHTK